MEKLFSKKSILSNFLVLSFLFLGLNSSSKADGLSINGYVDAYYATDNDANASVNRPPINSLSTQKDAFDINLAMLSFSYVNKDYRSKVTIQHGALARAAWPTYANMIQEANVGVRLADGLWLDAGYFLTHIGGEVITPKDNWLSSLALSTQNEPFYQSGMKLTYDVNDKLQFQLHALNGYNIFDDNNKNKSLGWCASYKFNDDLNVSLLGIYGNEAYLGLPIPSSSNISYNFTPKMLNNVVLNYNITKSFLMKASVDISSQDLDFVATSNKSKGTSSSLGGFLALRYLLSDNLSATARVEMYNSKSAVDGATPVTFTSNATGATIGTEYKANSNSYFRLEARSLNYDKANNSIYPFEKRLEGIFTFGVFF